VSHFYLRLSLQKITCWFVTPHFRSRIPGLGPVSSLRLIPGLLLQKERCLFVIIILLISLDRDGCGRMILTWIDMNIHCSGLGLNLVACVVFVIGMCDYNIVSYLNFPFDSHAWRKNVFLLHVTVLGWYCKVWIPDFLRSSGSGTGSTQPREDSWGATWKK
jgi:hypothetical protein